MPILNCNLEKHFYGKADASAFHRNFKQGKGKVFYDVIVHAIQSRPGKQLLFHVYTSFNANYSLVGLDEIYWKVPVRDGVRMSHDQRMLWDCFSENVSVITYDFLAGKRCKVMQKNGKEIFGNYFSTVYWYDNAFSEEPTQYKEGHLIFYDCGAIGCQPNNKIIWEDPSFGTGAFPKDPLSVIREIKSCESGASKWLSDESEDFYYKTK